MKYAYQTIQGPKNIMGEGPGWRMELEDGKESRETLPSRYGIDIITMNSQ